MKMLRARSVTQENIKRNKKRKLQLEILDKQRVDQWENQNVNMIINALPKSTPKMLDETVEKIKRKDPAGAMTAEATLGMLGVLKENVNGMHLKDLWSDPFRILYSEALTQVANQSANWKYIPSLLILPFGPDPKVHVLTACTGKKLTQSDMGQIRMQAEKVREGLEAFRRVDDDHDEECYVNGLRERFPEVLTQKDESAMNSALRGGEIDGNDDDDDDEDDDSGEGAEGKLSEASQRLSEASQDDITTTSEKSTESERVEQKEKDSSPEDFSIDSITDSMMARTVKLPTAMSTAATPPVVPTSIKIEKVPQEPPQPLVQTPTSLMTPRRYPPMYPPRRLSYNPPPRSPVYSPLPMDEPEINPMVLPDDERRTYWRNQRETMQLESTRRPENIFMNMGPNIYDGPSTSWAGYQQEDNQKRSALPSPAMQPKKMTKHENVSEASDLKKVLEMLAESTKTVNELTKRVADQERRLSSHERLRSPRARKSDRGNRRESPTRTDHRNTRRVQVGVRNDVTRDDKYKSRYNGSRGTGRK